jgi:DnaD and phage-associated domain
LVSILIKEDNLMVFQPKLAKLLGLNETIILNQIHYWLEKKKNIIDERPWVYNTYENWQEQICFLSVSTIKKAIKKLESMGIVIASNFNRSKIDKTKWYTIDYEALQKFYETENNQYKNEKLSEDKISQTLDKNNQRTDMNEPSKSFKISEEEVNSNQAIPETTTETNSDDNNKDDNKAQGEEPSLSKNLILSAEDKKLVDGFKKIVCFYSENVRMTGSYELEKIKYLHDEFKEPELIILALKQAIERNARNLRYVETVLYNWRDNGIKTSEEAEKFINSYKKYKGDRENGRFKGINRENKCYNSKASAKDSGKWSGYKPPEPKRRADTDDTGLI